MTDPVQFSCRRFREEVETFRTVATGFLDAESDLTLANFSAQIDNVLLGNHPTTLTVARDRPIRTVSCDGDYERSGRATHPDVRAEIACLWEVAPLGTVAKKATSDRLFEVAGIASTTIDLIVTPQDGGDEVKVASWRMEIANTDSPGTFFHVQIPDSTEPVVDSDVIEERFPLTLWPRWLPVPRIASYPFTPMLALDFVLGELFQSRWRDRIAAIGGTVKQSDVDRWANLQHDRLRRFFDWQQQVLATDTHRTPLQRLKWTHPPGTIFEPDDWKPIDRRRAGQRRQG